MAKFNVTAYHIKKPLPPMPPNIGDAVYTPCAAGAEFSIGLISSGPVPGTHEWKHGKARIFEWQSESRKVPEKWLRAEFDRRVYGKELSVEETGQIWDQTKAELWEKIVPTHKSGWAAYLQEENLLIIGAPIRLVEEVTHVLRMALGTLPIKSPWQSSAFEGMVRDMIANGYYDDDDLKLGSQVDMYEGSGREKVVVKFRNFKDLQSNHHVADHMKRCRNVASAGFNLLGMMTDEENDDFVSSSYGEMTIAEIKDKEADHWGVILTRLDSAVRVTQALQHVTDGYTSDNWRELE